MRFKKIVCLAMLCAGTVFLYQGAAAGLDISGCFPAYQGRFWNFSDDKSAMLSTWAINGSFTQRDIGTVFILLQDDGRFLALRDDWEGLRVYGEYGPDGYRIPQRPFVFLPREINTGERLHDTIMMDVYSLSSNKDAWKKTGQVSRTVALQLKDIEDITVAGAEIRNCAVLEKNTSEGDSSIAETLWLVPTIGPWKRVVRQGESERTYILQSYLNQTKESRECFNARDYFPLNPGLVWTYRTAEGKNCSIETKSRTEINGLMTTPYVVNIPQALNPNDTFYYAFTDKGLVLPQIYRSAMRGCTVFYPPHPPVTVFPGKLEQGVPYGSRSNPRVCKWPSRDPQLDYFPEMEYSGIPVSVEDVVVPAGEFKDCIKIATFSISRSFNFKIEKIRLGYIWLAKGKGVVKQQLLELSNYFLPQRVNEIADVQFWELVKKEKVRATPVGK